MIRGRGWPGVILGVALLVGAAWAGPIAGQEAPSCLSVSPDPDSVPGGPNGPDEAAATVPEILNRADINRALQREMQQLLRSRLMPSGQTVLWALVSPRGTVVHSEVKESSGSVAQDRAASRVVRLYRFASVVRDGCPVPAWLALPVTFQIR